MEKNIISYLGKKIVTGITLTAIALGSVGCSDKSSDRGSNLNIFPDPWSGSYVDEQRKGNDHGMVWYPLFPPDR